MSSSLLIEQLSTIAFNHINGVAESMYGFRAAIKADRKEKDFLKLFKLHVHGVLMRSKTSGGISMRN